jgi:hypothetical protein
MRIMIETGEFNYSKSFRSIAKVIEYGTLWECDYARIWLPISDAVVRVPASDLLPLSTLSAIVSPDYLVYVAAAAKVAEVLEGLSLEKHSGAGPGGPSEHLRARLYGGLGPS